MDGLEHSPFAVVIHGPLLWLGAFLGHGFWLAVVMNWMYGFNIHHKILDTARSAAILLILAGPVLFLDHFAFPEAMHLAGSGAAWNGIWRAYMGWCVVLGFVIGPICQIAYMRRRPAPQISRRGSDVVDVARQLGFAPSGSGKEAAAAHLPGNQVFQVEFTDLHLRLARLPRSWAGLTILHLTDLHFHHGMDRRFYRYVFDRCLMQWGTPDLVCVTGDIVDSAWHHRWIVPLLGRLRWNQAGLFLLGNHDTWWDMKLIRRRMRRLGFLDVGNTATQLEIRGEKLQVFGHEGPWIGPVPRPEPSATGAFSLCLSHTPDAIDWARASRSDLMLTGHVHGGQIRLPLVGSIFVPSRYSRHYDCGTFYRAPTVMHVGRGLSGKHLLRFNCRPEVTRLTLHCNG